MYQPLADLEELENMTMKIIINPTDPHYLVWAKIKNNLVINSIGEVSPLTEEKDISHWKDVYRYSLHKDSTPVYKLYLELCTIVGGIISFPNVHYSLILSRLVELTPYILKNKRIEDVNKLKDILTNNGTTLSTVKNRGKNGSINVSMDRLTHHIKMLLNHVPILLNEENNLIGHAYITSISISKDLTTEVFYDKTYI